MRGAMAGDSAGFRSWLDSYAPTLTASVKAEFAVVLSQLAAEFKAAALIDVDIEDVDGFTEFIEKYLGAFSQRWTDSSIGQLKALLSDIEDGDFSEIIGTRLDEWEERRPGKVAADEAVRSGNAVARFVWAAGGVKFLIWKTQGSKTCPFCRQLEGKKVGISEPFIAKGETLEASDGSGLKIYGKKLHAPIHGGCVCTIIPG